MGRPKIVVKPTRNKQAVVSLIAGNGETLMHSETLKSNTAVKKNITAMKKVAKTAVIVDKRDE